MNRPLLRSDLSADQTEIRMLERELRSQLRSRISDLRIEVCAEGLVLEGRTTTYYCKQLAQEALMEATTFRLASNAIDVV